jgi:multidrug efflux pump subunit AcrB
MNEHAAKLVGYASEFFRTLFQAIFIVVLMIFTWSWWNGIISTLNYSLLLIINSDFLAVVLAMWGILGFAKLISNIIPKPKGRKS